MQLLGCYLKPRVIAPLGYHLCQLPLSFWVQCKIPCTAAIHKTNRADTSQVVCLLWGVIWSSLQPCPCCTLEGSNPDLLYWTVATTVTRSFVSRSLSMPKRHPNAWGSYWHSCRYVALTDCRGTFFVWQAEELGVMMQPLPLPFRCDDLAGALPAVSMSLCGSSLGMWICTWTLQLKLAIIILNHKNISCFMRWVKVVAVASQCCAVVLWGIIIGMNYRLLQGTLCHDVHWMRTSGMGKEASGFSCFVACLRKPSHLQTPLDSATPNLSLATYTIILPHHCYIMPECSSMHLIYRKDSGWGDGWLISLTRETCGNSEQPSLGVFSSICFHQYLSCIAFSQRAGVKACINKYSTKGILM